MMLVSIGKLADMLAKWLKESNGQLDQQINLCKGRNNSFKSTTFNL
ncbi:MAG: hypothetical protein GW779_02980 [Candidatus Altiarchaeum hamiconexum]|uniref:Uncharacterized protein n=1 Tax=Candidatus Altarchaeum hamiconexum TaxID=1803513 RepID=A0A8J8CGZ6_9ARCH|nr:hypothetical protein [Candidatus Altarchaeum hamiconexum]NCN68370.1 hypothetical protein [Candidatus Altarchaeum hamiconexum]NCS91371.1 hypothetical protein [Candidatus Altarchaeum hamiconexum]